MDFAASSPLFDRFYPYPILSIYKSICLTKQQCCSTCNWMILFKVIAHVNAP